VAVKLAEHAREVREVFKADIGHDAVYGQVGGFQEVFSGFESGLWQFFLSLALKYLTLNLVESKFFITFVLPNTTYNYVCPIQRLRKK
jgi:hypothetical protein